LVVRDPLGLRSFVASTTLWRDPSSSNSKDRAVALAKEDKPKIMATADER
jgi:hypothetical protein